MTRACCGIATAGRRCGMTPKARPLVRVDASGVRSWVDGSASRRRLSSSSRPRATEKPCVTEPPLGNGGVTRLVGNARFRADVLGQRK